MASKAVQKAHARFQRINKLTELELAGDAAQRQAIRKIKKALSDRWTNREPKSLAGFFDQKKARAVKRSAV